MLENVFYQLKFIMVIYRYYNTQVSAGRYVLDHIINGMEKIYETSACALDVRIDI